MIRIFVYIFSVCILGIAFGWVANHNTSLIVTFPNFRLTVSAVTLLSAVILFWGIGAFLWFFFRTVFSIPRRLSSYFYGRREKRGREALSQGLLAVFSGDYVTAQKMEARALKYPTGSYEPLVKLLQAQNLFLQKNSTGSTKLYEEMRREESTKLVGLYGLFREAMNAKAYEKAQNYAEEALSLSPELLWANQAVLNRLSSEGQWDKALAVFERAQKILPRSARFTEERNQTHALLLSGKALYLSESNLVEARKTILKARKLVPDFIPITIITADILYKLNEISKADKMIVQAWQKNPHSDLGELYLKTAEGSAERLKRAKALASHNKDTFESSFLVAKAALDAGELVLAREQTQKALQYHPRESAYLLMADIEVLQGNDPARIRQWLSLSLHAERDPAWICDEVLFPSWLAVSPISGQLGRFEWKALPRRYPVALEFDNTVPKQKEEKEPIAEITFVKDKPLEEFSLIEDDLLNEDQIKEQGTKMGDRTRLNVDDPGVK